MLTTAIKLRIVGFLVLGAVVMAYMATTYADLGRYVGLRDHYRVRAELAETGGLFTGAKVTYRGVSVGRVAGIELTGTGVEAELHIEDDAPRVPADLTAEVASLSAVGEQYLDLRPTSATGPYLTDGSVIPRAATSTPPPVTDAISSLDDLAASVNLDALRTVVDELGQTFAGRGEDLQILLDTSSAFLDSAHEALPATTALITDAESVLRTQSEEGESLRAFARGTRELAAQLKESDPDLRRLIDRTPGAVTQVSALLRDVDPHLSVVLANLTTTSEVLLTRQRGVEELLVQAPRAVAAAATAVDGDGLRLGMTVTFFAPLPCTDGYGGTVYRNGLDTSKAPPLNTAARCTAPPGSGQNVRGSANAPSGGPLPEPAIPGALASRDDSGSGGGPGGGGPRTGESPRDLGGLLGLGDGR
ncbi:MlaD family protein [Streptomyces sp. TRM 70351]|uniref:MlaD family protein n=1 Tax=Streptomyces sp. TRM 70351 TaxID=3116552 RepID=UPI002E7C3260|nr:MlaD family protein [Streptomyces sp. TRM 70351]MEE1927050.1 MlaD family protein [Streptomyces sp. TRM 70351]